MAGKKFTYITSNALRNGKNPNLAVNPVTDGSSLGEAGGGSYNAVSTLRNIASDLETSDNGAKTIIKNRSEISVPSPWASIISFDTIMVSDDFGQLHEDAVNQWRGLLTIIALKDFIDLEINFHKVDLSAKYSENNVNKFYRNLIYLKPNSQLFGDSSCWDEFVFIECANMGETQNIGVLSNSGLVCPMYSYDSSNIVKILCEKEIMGTINKRIDFIDPIPFITKNSIQYLYMRKWLECIERILRTNILEENNLITLACGFINDFIEDLDKAISEAGEEELLKARGLDENRFIDFLFNFDGNVSKISEVFEYIYPNINVDAVKPLIQVYTGRSDKPLYVVEELSTELKEFLSRNNIKMDVNTGFFSEDDIFLDDLCLINCFTGTKVSEFTDSFEDSGYEKYVIWPIKNNIFERIKPYNINYDVRIDEILSGNFSDENKDKIKIKLEKIVDGTYRFHVVFPIYKEVNGKGTYKQLHIKHEYSGESIIDIFDVDIPSVFIWPYQKIKAQNNILGANLWNEYYVYEAMPSNQSVDFKYIAEIMVEDIIADNNFDLDLAYSKDKRERLVYKCEDVPTHIIFKKVSLDGTNGVELGAFILPKPNETIVNPNSEVVYNVAIDFGTTSTVAFYTTDNFGENSEFIEFGKLYEFREKRGGILEPVDCVGKMDDNGLKVIYNNPNYIDDNIAYFLPYRYYNQKAYPSIYQNNSSKKTADAKNLFSIGNVIFDYEIELSANDCIETEMKWGTTADNKRALKAYLSQIIKNIVYALIYQKQACKFTWKFSYPTSLRQESFDEFKNITKSVIDSLRESCDRNAFIFNSNGSQYCSESIVSAKFFQEQALSSRCMLYGCIDIGGGSTDISFWKVIEGNTPKNIIQVSVNIASRLIFLASIAELIMSDTNEESYTVLQESISELNRATYGRAIDEAIKAINGNFDGRDRIMRRFRTDIEPAIFKFGDKIKSFVDGRDNDELIPFKQELVLGFFGIMYYSVKSLELVKDSVSGSRDINLYFAGNGSKMYNWVGERYITNMRKVLSDELGINIHIEPLNENNLKTEASKGLLKLSRIDIDNIEFDNTEKMYNGEKVFVRYENKDFDIGPDYDLKLSENSKYIDYFSADSGEQNLKYTFEISPKLENLKKFVDIVNRKIFNGDKKMIIDLNADDWLDIYEGMKVIVNLNANAHKVDPSFIIGIQAILEILRGKRNNGGI